MVVLIVGAGVGGLASALLLARAGHSVRILERASALAEAGGGLQISPNGMKVLAHCGLDAAVLERGFLPESIEMRHGRSGELQAQFEIKHTAPKRWGASYVHIHRADLIDVLFNACSNHPNINIQMNTAVQTIESSEARCTVIDEHSQQYHADLLVGADGIHSVVRQFMHGDDRPRYTGHTAWRACIALADLKGPPPPPSACAWTGPGRHAVTTWLRGGQWVNFVGVVEDPQWKTESWRIKQPVDAAKAHFANWHPVIAGVLDSVDELYRWGLYDRAPLSHWHQGSAVLLGDAAHPMLPSAAQGAVQALEDAFVLADALAQFDDIGRALVVYESRRKPRATRVQKTSRQNAAMFHRKNALTQWLQFAPIKGISTFAPELFYRRYDWLYGG